MPTYAYACKQCSHRFDAVQSFAEPSLTECPECGGVLRKEYGQIGVTFNGSGFYRTDSRAGAAGGGTSGGKKDAAASSSSTATTSSSSSSSAGASASPAAAGS
ncbi:FmdB family transcriptional regulator [Microbacterium sp. zg.Y1090]|uniref:FmdB family zinc ribbon protein n=1 Tax=Microbacterium TaxID=33882 RepID=UPI00214CC507|nr:MULTISPECIES: FmdB family zinc ribbon protein [unclassified Microbacterium]MCR2812957.1 FmdB family transcriptional regulator [Microbacterium sp. zg.Y1084]MCR2817233.1 FmdB family transcriptional regulator [Microbacterium sp. zg.Y1090]MDL5486098.1 zinc ribbon domain-containing protein [Microbacterium sp. zg-Y1211]WIM29276.1 zinc ribbon domain-containing protein [Microbacterium sp. zg-Y1090]